MKKSATDQRETVAEAVRRKLAADSPTVQPAVDPGPANGHGRAGETIDPVVAPPRRAEPVEEAPWAPAGTLAAGEPPAPPPRRSLTGREWFRLVLLGLLLVVLGAGASVTTSLLLPPTYASRVEVMYKVQNEQSTGFLREDRNLTTQAVLMTSRAVLEPVAAANGMTVEDLGKKVTATIVEGSDFITIEAHDRNRTTATAIADAVAKSYLNIAGHFGELGTRQYLTAQQAAVAAQIAALPAGTTNQALTDQAAAIKAQLDALNTSINATGTGADATGPLSQIVVPAYSVPDPVGFRPPLAAGLGALGGLLVAVVAAALLARRWTRR
ncbi:hypothetical protein [Pseudonocardia acidicola]|uniref:Polysaccharide chain length determinant N-terminal domain-containing protein n=1 Tax=Pseudonocardia acidicola TaxID=2724939 RepID=A0ABX1SFE8_9PSEU|nr:hypothetical protein [Pseudonocardia acidicola]NMI00269.1 hypothetical protein [Pseudonocardia acidicola]